MKKAVLMLAMLASLSFAGKAQTTDVEVMEVPVSRYSVQTNRFWDNWFISLGGGGQAIYGTPKGSADLGDRLQPNMQFAVGKWFSPSIGLRTQINGLWSTQVWGDGATETFQYMNLHGDVLFNLSNILVGYNPTRVYNCIPYAGFGTVHAFDLDHAWNMAMNFGIINRFRLSSAIDLGLELYTTMTSKTFDCITTQRHGMDYIVGGALSLTVSLPKQGWQNVPNLDDITALNAAQVAALNDMLTQCQQQNNQLKNQLANQPKPKETVATATIVNTLLVPQSIFFAINSSQLASQQDHVNLEAIAAWAKQSGNSLSLTGYADSETGTPAYNEQLSLERAQMVADALAGMGVPRSQMSVKGGGGVSTLSPYENNRRVVITAAQ